VIRLLWNKFIGWARGEKWAYVKMFTVEVSQGERKGKVYIHCYESNTNKRKINALCTITDINQSITDEFVRSLDLYQERLVRWLNGRYDPEIPRYSQIGEEDTANALKGTIE
jgi:hypothetical protein